MSALRVGLLLLAAALALPRPAWAWWSNDWAFRKQITLDLSATGAGITGSPTDVPVLIRLHSGNFTYFNDVQANGNDIRFVAADDKTPLKFHVERFDATNQIALMWVKVPRLTGGTNSDFIYLYYGNEKALAGSEPGAQNSLSVRLEKAPFDKLITWLGRLAQQNGVVVDSATIEKAGAPGEVNAAIVLHTG